MGDSMMDHKWKVLLICVGCLSFAFDAISDYYFSFMQNYHFLAFCVLFGLMIFLFDHLFTYIWGIMTGLLVLVPMLNMFIHGSNNYIAMIFDGVLSILLIIYFGYKIYRRKTEV